jgi:rod shape determining protein RodA
MSYRYGNTYNSPTSHKKDGGILPESIDSAALTIIFALMLIGWVSVYTAVYDAEHQSIFDFSQSYGKQLIWIATSIVLFLVIMSLDYRLFESLAYIIYGIAIVALIATIFLSTDIKGSKSWIKIGSASLQPAEFGKFATALALSAFLGKSEDSFKTLRTRLICVGMILLPMVIIILQKETGSALVYCAFIFMFYREGLPGEYLLLGLVAIVLSVLALIMNKYIILGAFALMLGYYVYQSARRTDTAKVAGIILLGAVMLVFSVNFMFENILQPHQRTRISVLLGTETDNKGAGYNVRQSLIAIGSGGLSGKGFLQGTQTKFNFVPEQSTDFIFCTIGEEFGFLGSTALLLLFFGLIYRLVVIAERQTDRFGRVYGYSVASIIFFHILVNIGMTIGLLPVIGIPLPFVSYGGSSLWAFTFLIGILMRLDSRRKSIWR